MQGKDDGETGADDRFARRAMDDFGAFILGRTLFGPVRGDWPDASWTGWWADTPPYHAPTFILPKTSGRRSRCKAARPSTSSPTASRAGPQKARATAGVKDIKIGGGAATVRQYIQAGHVDEIHLAVAPIVLGKGEPLFSGLDQRSGLPNL